MTKFEDEPGHGHGLGPHVVGQRVVVRRILPGQTGPTGGPAFTDLLGVCESWAPPTATIRTADGELVVLATADVVSGKPVPPRPSRFSRLSAEDVQQRGTAMFRPAATEHLGDWLLRVSGGANARPNSALAAGDPGVPLDEALARTVDFYARHGRPACVQAVVGSPLLDELEARGWGKLRPDEADAEVHLAGVARLARSLAGTVTDDVRTATAIDRDWLVGNTRALDNYDAVEKTLRLDDVAFLSVGGSDAQQARGRINRDGDWTFFADLDVHPQHRRRGLARVVMAAATAWAAERGASVMMLQVLADNVPALALYDALGFERHHAYRYLVPPSDRGPESP